MGKESSSELSTLASSVMRKQPYADNIGAAGTYNELLADAKRLAGSVLSQDETPGQNARFFTKAEFEAEYPRENTLPEEQVERAHDEAANLPQPNALEPDAMRKEFINVILGKGGISQNKAETIIDAILIKQMQFYAAVADPQMEADNREQLSVVMEAKGIIEALVRQGAAVVEFMGDRSLWQRTAARARELATKMEAMFS